MVPLRIVLVNTLVETIIILGPSNKLLKRVSSNKLNKEDVQETAKVVNELMEDFMKKLKEISPNFGWSHFNSGSYYDKTKVTSFHKMQWAGGGGSKIIYIFSYKMFEDNKDVIRNLKSTNRTGVLMDN